MICRTQAIPKTRTIFSDEASNASKYFNRVKFFVKAYYNENRFLPFFFTRVYFLKARCWKRSGRMKVDIFKVHESSKLVNQ